MNKKSKALFDRSKKLIPGGVNSPVRAFNAVGGVPRFFGQGKGARLWDEDGRSYIDYVCSWGPLILGHAHPAVVHAVSESARKGLSFGAPTVGELEMAEILIDSLPSIEKVRLVNSGTEATMSAIRLARGFTGRSIIIKFEGCYHGHVDSLLLKAGSGALTFGKPSSAGIPNPVVQDTIVLAYNDVDSLEKAFSEFGNQIAAVIVEPVAGNMNLIRATVGFLKSMRSLCSDHGVLLIFDEVMTGFRVNKSGAQGLLGIQPDLTTLGKVIGGGLPIGALGGRADIMDCLAPIGDVYQAGTLSGNPVSIAAGLATLKQILRPGVLDRLFETTNRLVDGINQIGQEGNLPIVAQSCGSMFGIYFRSEIPKTFREVLTCDSKMFNQFFHYLLENGIYLAPSSFEVGFTSIAIGEKELEETLDTIGQAIRFINSN